MNLNKKKGETILGELKHFLWNKRKQTLPVFLVFYILVIILASVTLSLVSNSMSALIPYETLLFDDVKPTIELVGELNPETEMKFLAFGEVLNTIIVEVAIILLVSAVIFTFVRLARDFFLWKRLDLPHKIEAKHLLHLKLWSLATAIIFAILIFLTIQFIANPFVILLLLLAEYLLWDTFILFFEGSIFMKKKKRHSPHLLPLLLLSLLIINILFALALFITLIVIGLLSFLPGIILAVLILLFFFSLFTKKEALKLIVTKRLFRGEL